ncbi:MAG: cupin domain-containing protein, partial [Planctomycetales bacterium]|nr:cupin domain-containing protein [Planctomycetales bacterium]
ELASKLGLLPGKLARGPDARIAGQIVRPHNSKMTIPIAKFADMAWTDIATGVREKRIESPRHTMRLVEFSPGFIERDWCQKSHFGYVLSGELAIQFRDNTVRYQQGDGICIDAGAESEHKAIVTEVVILFLVEPTLSNER